MASNFIGNAGGNIGNLKNEVDQLKQQIPALEQQATTAAQAAQAAQQQAIAAEQAAQVAQQQANLVNQELQATRQELASAKQDLTLVQQELASAQQELASALRDLQNLTNNAVTTAGNKRLSGWFEVHNNTANRQGSIFVTTPKERPGSAIGSLVFRKGEEADNDGMVYFGYSSSASRNVVIWAEAGTTGKTNPTVYFDNCLAAPRRAGDAATKQYVDAKPFFRSQAELNEFRSALQTLKAKGVI